MKTIFFIAIFTFVQCLILQAQVIDKLVSPFQLPYLDDSRLLQISSYDTTGENADFIRIEPGATATLANVEGSGVIVRFWVTISSRDPNFLRKILLRMYWDNEEYPSVETPIGDFFGTGLMYKQWWSQFIGMTSGGYFCYFPMPFNGHARVEIVNQSELPIISFYYHLAYQKLTKPLEVETGYFHTQWRRELRTDPKSNYVVLDAQGKGKYVGTILSMQAYNGQLSFLEGDEMVYVDGETFPSIYGTGTEDYFTSGWYFNKGEYSTPYHGLILKDDSLARIVAYRFHVGDHIPFSKSIRFTIEHGHKNTEVADYSSIAYWYQREPHLKFAEMPKAAQRIPLRVIVANNAIEAESITPESVTVKFSRQDMSDIGVDWSGQAQLRTEFQKPSDEIVLNVPIPYRSTFDVDVYFSKAPNYGNCDIYAGKKQVGTISGYNRTMIHGGKVTLKGLVAQNKSLPLRFVCSGKDARSSGFELGLDAFFLNPERIYIPKWNVIGPFPNQTNSQGIRTGIDAIYPPETEIDFTKSYTGINRHVVKWRSLAITKEGKIELYSFNPYEGVVVYAHTYIYSPKDRTALLLLGTDDGVKVILNGKTVHRVLTVRVAQPDEDKIELPLQKGWNSLLLKIENNLGGYEFFARIVDEEGTLKIKTEKK
jgi:hypothetical protein